MRYLLTGFVALLTLSLFYSCQKELSIEYGSAAKGSLQSSAGDCLPKTLGGTYVAAKGLNDSNFVDVTVNVTAAGPYKIYSDTLNGYSFLATGTFNNTGQVTVRLKGSGTPGSAVTDDFTIYFDTTSCDIAVTVLPAGSSGGAAVFNLGANAGACTPFTPSGNYVKDTALNTTNFVTVTVNITTTGTYSISTNTVNGYFFSATGIFANTGSQTVKLYGVGKPVAAGTDNFTATAGTSTCTFSITVMATAPAGCNPNVQGTYTAGTAATAINQVTLTHTYTAAGTYTVSVDPVNGYSFASTTINAAAGVATAITLTATGTPTASGADNFTVKFGDGQTCSFTVSVINNDYFPTTLNSYWTYDDETGPDTFKVTVTGPITRGSNTYQKFTYSGVYNGDEYYRKDASGYYYQSFDTAGWGKYGITFNQSMYEVRFMKNGLSTGALLPVSDVPVTYQNTAVTLRYVDTCEDANHSITVNGQLFSNVYKIKQWVKLGFPTTNNFPIEDGPYYYYYAKGVGLIYAEDATSIPLSVIQRIRYWVVN